MRRHGKPTHSNTHTKSTCKNKNTPDSKTKIVTDPLPFNTSNVSVKQTLVAGILKRKPRRLNNMLQKQKQQKIRGVANWEKDHLKQNKTKKPAPGRKAHGYVCLKVQLFNLRRQQTDRRWDTLWNVARGKEITANFNPPRGSLLNKYN